MNNNQEICDNLHAVVNDSAHHRFEIKSENDRVVHNLAIPSAIIEAESGKFYGFF